MSEFSERNKTTNEKSSQNNIVLISGIGEVAISKKELMNIERQLDLNGHKYDASKGNDPIDSLITEAKSKLLNEIKST